jgi:predicted regulator of Ras-like GTPase activity (Roadblock/LC7/MglB family)
MFFYGNFAIISPSSLLQLLCQERRSVVVSAWYGTSYCQIEIAHGAIVSARCDSVTGTEAIYAMLAWEHGQFQLEPINVVEPVTSLGAWEELVLEAARQRDERRLQVPPPINEAATQELRALLRLCPAVAGIAVVGYDGRMVAQVAMHGFQTAQILALAGGLAAVGKALKGKHDVALYSNGSQRLLLATWGSQSFVLALPAPDAKISDVARQLAYWTTKIA